MSESSQNQTQVSITAKFSFPEGDTSKQEPTPVVEQTFDSSNCEPAILGLPPGVDPVKPKGGDYSYSGMHDHGPLPAPKEGGDFALLIHMVQQAKKKSDELLTNIIEKEKNSAKMKRLEKQGNKKQKVER